MAFYWSWPVSNYGVGKVVWVSLELIDCLGLALGIDEQEETAACSSKGL